MWGLVLLLTILLIGFGLSVIDYLIDIREMKKFNSRKSLEEFLSSKVIMDPFGRLKLL